MTRKRFVSREVTREKTRNVSNVTGIQQVSVSDAYSMSSEDNVTDTLNYIHSFDASHNGKVNLLLTERIGAATSETAETKQWNTLRHPTLPLNSHLLILLSPGHIVINYSSQQADNAGIYAFLENLVTEVNQILQS